MVLRRTLDVNVAGIRVLGFLHLVHCWDSEGTEKIRRQRRIGKRKHTAEHSGKTTYAGSTYIYTPKRPRLSWHHSFEYDACLDKDIRPPYNTRGIHLPLWRLAHTPAVRSTPETTPDQLRPGVAALAGD
jgi:hypothetical protein